MTSLIPKTQIKNPTFFHTKLQSKNNIIYYQNSMFQEDTFEVLQKSINKIETVISDPFLSQFKYHFVIKKLPIFYLIHDKFRWTQFILTLYKGFSASYMGHNSIHIVQLLNAYPQLGLVDLIVGLRRDQHALKFYRQIHCFEFQNQKYEIEAAQGFKTYLDQLSQKYRQQAAERQKIRAEQGMHRFKSCSEAQQEKMFKPILKLLNQTSNSSSLLKEKQPEQFNSEKQEIPGFSSKIIWKESSKQQNLLKISDQLQNIKKNNEREHSCQSSKCKQQKKNLKMENSPLKKSNTPEKYQSQNSNRKDSSNSSNCSQQKTQQKKGNQANRDRSRNKKNIKQSQQESGKNSNYKKISESSKKSYANKYEDRKEKIKDHEEQNQKYEIYPPFNRAYSPNYNYHFVDVPNTELPKTYSYEIQNPYSLSTRYEVAYSDYQKAYPQNLFYSTYYNNHLPGYTLARTQEQIQKKQSNPTNEQIPSHQEQPKFRYGNKNNDYY